MLNTEMVSDITLGTVIWLASLGFEMNVNDGQITEIKEPQEA